MEQLIVEVTDKQKAQALYDILAALDFVNSVQIHHEQRDTEEETNDFFDLAGIWAARDINADSLRKQAWPERNQ